MQQHHQFDPLAKVVVNVSADSLSIDDSRQAEYVAVYSNEQISSKAEKLRIAKILKDDLSQGQGIVTIANYLQLFEKMGYRNCIEDIFKCLLSNSNFANEDLDLRAEIFTVYGNVINPGHARELLLGDLLKAKEALEVDLILDALREIGELDESYQELIEIAPRSKFVVKLLDAIHNQATRERIIQSRYNQVPNFGPEIFAENSEYLEVAIGIIPAKQYYERQLIKYFDILRDTAELSQNDLLIIHNHSLQYERLDPSNILSRDIRLECLWKANKNSLKIILEREAKYLDIEKLNKFYKKLLLFSNEYSQSGVVESEESMESRLMRSLQIISHINGKSTEKINQDLLTPESVQKSRDLLGKYVIQSQVAAISEQQLKPIVGLSQLLDMKLSGQFISEAEYLISIETIFGFLKYFVDGRNLYNIGNDILNADLKIRAKFAELIFESVCMAGYPEFSLHYFEKNYENDKKQEILEIAFQHMLKHSMTSCLDPSIIENLNTSDNQAHNIFAAELLRVTKCPAESLFYLQSKAQAGADYKLLVKFVDCISTNS